MPTKEIVEFTRYTVPIEIRFINGLECCEWCNHSFMNMKRHFECDLNLIERMYKVEDSAKSAHHRIDELREELK